MELKIKQARQDIKKLQASADPSSDIVTRNIANIRNYINFLKNK